MILESFPEFWLCYKPEGVAVNDIDGEPGFISRLKQETGRDKLHPVHRLDAETSGLMLVALTTDANQIFSKLFQASLINKRYIAITRCPVGKKPKKKQGRIKGDMKNIRQGSYRLFETQVNPAITHFESTALVSRYRFVNLLPKTGKTHQLRVAMKAVGMPVVGDKRYGGEVSDRMYLHAYALSFDFKGQPYSFQCEPKSGELFKRLHFSELMSQGESV